MSKEQGIITKFEVATLEEIDKILENEPQAKFIFFKHQDKLAQGQSFINLARNSDEYKRSLVKLTNKGFHLYMVKDNQISSFVKHENIKCMWQKVISGEYKVFDDDIIYSLTPPISSSGKSNLLVIFSSIGSDVYSPLLGVRLFEKNYAKADKYVSPNTAILRIPDIGGVVGAFYLNTNYLPNNEDKIQRLIRSIASEVGAMSVVLFGTSKGGTAALFHALTGDYHGVVSDPVLNDEYYFSAYNDSHFTENTFPETKEAKFERLVKSVNLSNDKNISIISSKVSAQFGYNFNFYEKSKGLSFFETLNPSISCHDDVARNSIHIISMLMNMSLNQVPLKNDHYFVQ